MRFLNRRELKKLSIWLSAVLFLFSIIAASFYINDCLKNASKAVQERAENTAEQLTTRLRSLKLFSFTIYSDASLTRWINAQEASPEQDVNAVQACWNYLQTSDPLIDILLYNPNTKFLYAATSYTWRDLEQFPEQEALALLRCPTKKVLRFSCITYQNRPTLALCMPPSSADQTTGRMLLLYDVERIADSIGSLLNQSMLDGSMTFVTAEDGQLLMGTANQRFITLAHTDASSASLWYSVFREGYLARSAPVADQVWQVHSILFLDAFLSAYMSFVKIVALCVVVLFFILLFLLLQYIRILRSPYLQLAQTLRERLPNGTMPQPETASDERSILSDLQGGIQYLLNHFTESLDAETRHWLDSRLIAWANTLGTNRSMEFDRTRFFPEKQLLMGLAWIHCFDLQSDYFVRRKHQQAVCDALNDLLSEHYNHASCVSMGDGCFVLFLNAAQLDEAKIPALFEEMSDRLLQQLKLTVCFAFAPAVDHKEGDPSELYRRLYEAAYPFFGGSDQRVYTLEEAEKLRQAAPQEPPSSFPKVEKTPQWHETVVKISDYIRSNLADPQLSVEMIAQKEGYSTNYIRTMFKTYVGVSITDTIRQQRIEMACSLLRNTTAPITEIAEQSGFTNRTSFFTTFKNAMGVTPNEYRQQCTEAMKE